MRFREIFRGSESQPDNLKYGALAAVILHNIMLSMEGAPIDNLEREEDDIVLLEHNVIRENHELAGQVREAILPLVL